jgi:hypothetical protein
VSQTHVPLTGEASMIFGVEAVGSPGLLARIVDGVWLDDGLRKEIVEAHRIAKIRLKSVYEELESLRHQLNKQVQTPGTDSDLIELKEKIVFLESSLKRAHQDQRDLNKRHADSLTSARASTRSSEEALTAWKIVYDQVFNVADSRLLQIKRLYQDVAKLRAQKEKLQQQLREEKKLTTKLHEQNQELLARLAEVNKIVHGCSQHVTQLTERRLILESRVSHLESLPRQTTQLEDERRHSAELAQTIEFANREIALLSNKLHGEKQ